MLLLSTPYHVLASCGSIPDAPELLNKQRVNTVELSSLDQQFTIYLDAIEQFQDCIDSSVISLDIESETYESDFQDLMMSMELAEQQKLLAADQFNVHVDTVDIDPLNSETNPSESPVQ